VVGGGRREEVLGTTAAEVIFTQGSGLYTTCMMYMHNFVHANDFAYW
jgi:hypothetical protein